ncbi:Fic family protein [Salmonella enterica subsp. enterica serovar Nigeria]|nr:Fic family protein [Salmonella enterica subsp. enterica serovar Nigeria]
MASKKPPKRVALNELTAEQYAHYQARYRVTDDKGRYLAWDEFQPRKDRGDDSTIAWTFTRNARDASMQRIAFADEKGQQAGFNLTPTILEACASADRTGTSQALELMTAHLGNVIAAMELLRFEEAISSSQLEGANTTTLIAREMLETGRKPRTVGEHMIMSNARLMDEIRQHLEEPLTVDLIQQLHAVGMSGIDDGKYKPGQIRETDDVVIEDAWGEIVHQPPAAALLPGRLQLICDFANDGSAYIHPLIRACILHFMLAHEHPFNDGNGRTSRALFYWFMLKSGYGVFRYVSISSLLKSAASAYGKSYQHTEGDGMDLTYFLEHQCKLILRALEAFADYTQKTIFRRSQIDKYLFESGAFKRLSKRQADMLAVIYASPEKPFSAVEMAELMGVSENTARNDLRQLLRENLLEYVKINKQLTRYISKYQL